MKRPELRVTRETLINLTNDKESVDAPFRAEYLLNKLAAKMEVANITFMRRNDNWVLLGCMTGDIYGVGATVVDCLNDAVVKGNL